MDVLLSVILGIVTLKLVLLAAIEPRRSRLSSFELSRLKKSGTADVALDVSRETYAVDIISLTRVMIALLLVVFTLISVELWGIVLGMVASVMAALFYGNIARLPMIRRVAQHWYNRFEPTILHMMSRYQPVMKFIRSTVANSGGVGTVHSREEFEHIVASSGTILTADERKLINNSLQANDREVSEIMTPKSVIDSVPADELLGPLVLNDLHQTGHTRFPVTDGDIDHIVGVLQMQHLFAIKAQESVKARDAMEPVVYYIRSDHSLMHALTAFIKTKHHLFIVINQYRETIGLVTLEDVMEAILGRKIVDEFDRHDDLRAVASRNVGKNNLPIRRHDV